MTYELMRMNTPRATKKGDRVAHLMRPIPGGLGWYPFRESLCGLERLAEEWRPASDRDHLRVCPRCRSVTAKDQEQREAS